MPHEVKQSKSTAQKLADRLKNGGGDFADEHTVHGTGPTRVHHNIHHGHGGKMWGPAKPGEKGYQDTHDTHPTLPKNSRDMI